METKVFKETILVLPRSLSIPVALTPKSKLGTPTRRLLFRLFGIAKDYMVNSNVMSCTTFVLWPLHISDTTSLATLCLVAEFRLSCLVGNCLSSFYSLPWLSFLVKPTDQCPPITCDKQNLASTICMLKFFFSNIKLREQNTSTKSWTILASMYFSMLSLSHTHTHTYSMTWIMTFIGHVCLAVCICE